jgi:hypothetical protein
MIFGSLSRQVPGAEDLQTTIAASAAVAALKQIPRKVGAFGPADRRCTWLSQQCRWRWLDETRTTSSLRSRCCRYPSRIFCMETHACRYRTPGLLRGTRRGVRFWSRTRSTVAATSSTSRTRPRSPRPRVALLVVFSRVRVPPGHEHAPRNSRQEIPRSILKALSDAREQNKRRSVSALERRATLSAGKKKGSQVGVPPSWL